jgi:putative ABC transport system permease protein
VAGASGLPMTNNVSLLGPFQVEGVDVPENVLPEIRLVTVTPEYFDVIGTPLLSGRWFDQRDVDGAPLTVLLNRAAVARWFPDGNAVGKRVLLGGNPREVIGIVGDVLQRTPGTPISPEMYAPYAQRSTRTLRLVVHGRADVGSLASRIRAEVNALDPDLPVGDIEPLESVISNAVARPRLYTTLLSIFAFVAYALAIVGIFGVMSYIVAQRSREISIRMALGADRSSVISMVVSSAMKVAAAGLALGIGAALATGKVLESQLFGVEVADVPTLASVFLMLGGAAAIASFIPARRAARVEPGAVLRGG